VLSLQSSATRSGKALDGQRASSSVHEGANQAALDASSLRFGGTEGAAALLWKVLGHRFRTTKGSGRCRAFGFEAKRGAGRYWTSGLVQQGTLDGVGPSGSRQKGVLDGTEPPVWCNKGLWTVSGLRARGKKGCWTVLGQAWCNKERQAQLWMVSSLRFDVAMSGKQLWMVSMIRYAKDMPSRIVRLPNLAAVSNRHMTSVMEARRSCHRGKRSQHSRDRPS
jgi:hypothetical protein